MTQRNIEVVAAKRRSIENIPVEIVERKGIGHPDSLCDAIAERISVEYSCWCQDNLGVLLHHNFDKVQLVAGEVDIDYGRAQMLTPIRIQIAGRATPLCQGKKVPIDDVAIQAAKLQIRESMKYLDPDRHMVIDSYAGRGAEELQHVVAHVTANDTSFGVSYWPRSALEEVVFKVAEYINRTLITELPVGEDIKVMGLRRNNALTLTIALPFMALQIRDAASYQQLKKDAAAAIHAYAQSLDERQVNIMINTADNLDQNAVYLTLTGTSAEMGDDGAVGRGNRVNGVIAPFRSTSLEAACGKNPISHVGKIYNVMALLASQDIIRRVPTVREVTVYLLSQIGSLLDQPLVATALIHPTNGSLTSSIIDDVRAVLDENLAQADTIQSRMLNREMTLF
ncbi:methionine adenosyltransferase [candidate division CSSED10-310 bacterium]|uniref:Methionine adenosyltransferase n=1 Tax=candidate division CSSED10-310 bacterium TaxID=2855610 RepID=A0ABV6YT73_UNCC1